MPSGSSVAPALSALALALALAACGTAPTKLLGLRSVDEAALDACREPVQARACGDRADGEACWQEVVAAYEALADDPARKRFLIDAGCPSPTVETWLVDPR